MDLAEDQWMVFESLLGLEHYALNFLGFVHQLRQGDEMTSPIMYRSRQNDVGAPA